MKHPDPPKLVKAVVKAAIRWVESPLGQGIGGPLWYGLIESVHALLSARASKARRGRGK